MLVSIPEKVEEMINTSPYLREAMANDLLNLSAVARYMQPQIAEALLKPVSNESVFMALQRLQKKLHPFFAVNPGHYLNNLELRADLFELTVTNSTELLSKLSRLAKTTADRRAALFVFTQGQHETMIITSTSLKPEIMRALHDETITTTVPDLTGITLQRSPGQIERTGVLYYPLRILAWENISVIEIITTSHEIMMIVRDFEVDRAVVSIRRGLQTVKQHGAETTD